jgi:hypothetical protein
VELIECTEWMGWFAAIRRLLLVIQVANLDFHTPVQDKIFVQWEMLCWEFGMMEVEWME